MAVITKELEIERKIEKVQYDIEILNRLLSKENHPWMICAIQGDLKKKRKKLTKLYIEKKEFENDT